MTPAGEMAGGRVSFSDTTGYMSKIRVQFCGKVAPAGCTQHIFRLGRVKTCVDQSAQLISRWIKMGTLLCRQMTRVHPVVSFTLISIGTCNQIFFVFTANQCSRKTTLSLKYRHP